jgi:hypothetical protein
MARRSRYRHVGQRRCDLARLRFRSVECAQLECIRFEFARFVRNFSGRIDRGNGNGIDERHQRLAVDPSSDGRAIAGRSPQHRDGRSGYHGIAAWRPLNRSLLPRDTFNGGGNKSG